VAGDRRRERPRGRTLGLDDAKHDVVSLLELLTADRAAGVGEADVARGDGLGRHLEPATVDRVARLDGEAEFALEIGGRNHVDASGASVADRHLGRRRTLHLDVRRRAIAERDEAACRVVARDLRGRVRPRVEGPEAARDRRCARHGGAGPAVRGRPEERGIVGVRDERDGTAARAIRDCEYAERGATKPNIERPTAARSKCNAAALVARKRIRVTGRGVCRKTSGRRRYAEPRKGDIADDARRRCRYDREEPCRGGRVGIRECDARNADAFHFRIGRGGAARAPSESRRAEGGTALRVACRRERREAVAAGDDSEPASRERDRGIEAERRRVVVERGDLRVARLIEPDIRPGAEPGRVASGHRGQLANGAVACSIK